VLLVVRRSHRLTGEMRAAEPLVGLGSSVAGGEGVWWVRVSWGGWWLRLAVWLVVSLRLAARRVRVVVRLGLRWLGLWRRREVPGRPRGGGSLV
jgi:hypothetical protein